MGDRDEANLRQFISRSKQPKFIAEGPVTKNPAGTSDINIYLQFDSPFGGYSNEVDDLRFRNWGTSPTWSMYDNSCSRRNGQACMRSTFQA